MIDTGFDALIVRTNFYGWGLVIENHFKIYH